MRKQASISGREHPGLGSSEGMKIQRLGALRKDPACQRTPVEATEVWKSVESSSGNMNAAWNLGTGKGRWQQGLCHCVYNVAASKALVPGCRPKETGPAV